MKKVLFVTYDFPYPTNTGGKNRAYHMLKYSGPEFKKYLFSFIRPDFNRDYIEKMREIDVEVAGLAPRRGVFDPRNIVGLLARGSVFKALYFSKPVLDELVGVVRKNQIDIVHFESFFTSFFLSEELRMLGVKQVYGSENIEHEMYKDYAAKAPALLKPLYDLQAEKIRLEEENAYSRADVVVAVSDPDAKVVRAAGAACEIVRNGVDIDEFKFNRVRAKAANLLFVGNFTYFPNVDAINYFYNDIFAQLPHFSLTIIGKKASKLAFARNQDVNAVEFIPDIQDAYAKADIMVAPIRMGGGTNFKILEAMAAGIPVISLPQRLAGLGVKNGQNIIIAESAQEFKDGIVKLAADVKLREKIAGNARKLAEREFSWKVIGNNLATVWKNL